MPETIDIHIKNIQSKLQLLLKKQDALVKENRELIIENQAYKSNEKKITNKLYVLEQQVNILRASAGKLEGVEKTAFEKTISQYITSIEKCIHLLNT